MSALRLSPVAATGGASSGHGGRSDSGTSKASFASRQASTAVPVKVACVTWTGAAPRWYPLPRAGVADHRLRSVAVHEHRRGVVQLADYLGGSHGHPACNGRRRDREPRGDRIDICRRRAAWPEKQGKRLWRHLRGGTNGQLPARPVEGLLQVHVGARSLGNTGCGTRAPRPCRATRRRRSCSHLGHQPACPASAASPPCPPPA